MLKYKKIKNFFDGHWTGENFSEFLCLQGIPTSDDLCRKSPISGLDLSETVMSDEAEGNLLKISIAKQIFTSMPPNWIILSTENYYKNFFCKYIRVLNQHAIHLKLTPCYASRKLEGKVLRDFKKRGALTPPFGLWRLMSDLAWSRDYDTGSVFKGL